MIQSNQMQEPPPPSRSSGGAAAAAPASPPSASSSPSHEFTFTISLNPTNSKKSPVLSTKPNVQSSLAIDLSPADDIFFHGHLLPLHLLSHLPVSPRTSTNSIDRNLLQEQKLHNSNIQTKLDDDDDDDNSYYDLNHSFHHHHHEPNPSKEKPKSSKSFSLFKWRKGEKEEKEKQGKLKFDVSQVLKRYMRMVRPFLSFRSRKNIQFHGQSYSFSGNLSFRGKSKEIRGIKRGAYSAPVSMKNSPTNSGVLVATPGAYNPNSSDSTMEELQAAIQAAIAHCKKSSSMDPKIK